MKRRIAYGVGATAILWLATSLVLVGGTWPPHGHWSALWWRLREAAGLDEELIVFAAALLFSVAVAVEMVALRFRVGCRGTLRDSLLGAAYAVGALIAGSILRLPLRQPWEEPFHVLFVLAAGAGFVMLFGRRYVRILKQGKNSEAAV